MKISIITHQQSHLWDEYVHMSPVASIYHLSCWADLIKKIFGHDSFQIAAFEDGKISGVLLLTRLKSPLFGDFMISMPYFNYGGAVGNTPEIEKALMGHANNIAKRLNISHIEYRDIQKHEGLPVKIDKVTMLLKLPKTEEALWKSFSSKLRAQIKRPLKEGVETTIGGMELIEDFYSVFSKNMRDLGTPVYSSNFFREIVSSFEKNSQIIVIKHQQRPVAAAFLIGFNGTLEIPWASSLREYNHISVNMALYWETLRYAINNRYHTFDFGRCSRDSGTYKFKRQWGATEKQLYWHYWLKDGGTSLPALNPNNPKYRLAIRVWKRLPLKVTNLIGPVIVKYLP